MLIMQRYTAVCHGSMSDIGVRVWLHRQQRNFLDWFENKFVVYGTEPVERDSYPLPLDIF